MSSKHTKRGRRERFRAWAKRHAWMRWPWRTLRGEVVCYVCHAVQPSDPAFEIHMVTCDAWRLGVAGMVTT